MTYTLSLFNTGQVTLPKKWRDKQNTKKFIAKVTPEGLLIKPLLDEDFKSVYYEDEKSFGLYCNDGVDPEVLIDKIKDIQNG